METEQLQQRRYSATHSMTRSHAATISTSCIKLIIAAHATRLYPRPASYPLVWDQTLTHQAFAFDG